MSAIRILHASDLHIAKYNKGTSPIEKHSIKNDLYALKHRQLASTYDMAVLRCFVELALRLSDPERTESPIDAVIITGDIATTGLQKDLQVAKRFLTSNSIGGPFNKLLEPTIGGLRKPVWILPGNHDRYQRSVDTFYKQGSATFDTELSTQWQGPVMVYEPPLIRAGLCVRILAADFSLSDPNDYEGNPIWNCLAQGRVYSDVLDILVANTNAIRNDHSLAEELIVLWAIHFPPQYPNLSDQMRLIDEDILIARANECQVSAILAGHTHEPAIYRKPGMRFNVFCAGTTSQFHAPEGNHCEVVTVRRQAYGLAAIECQSFLFDKENSEFYEV